MAKAKKTEKTENIDDLIGGEVAPEETPGNAPTGFVFVDHKGTGVLSLLNLVDLKPGNNKVPADKWEQVKGHWLTAHRLEVGDLVVVAQAASEADSKSVLLAMSEAKAEKTVKDTTDLEVLRGWFELEKRPKIRKALDAQIAELLAPLPKA